MARTIVLHFGRLSRLLKSFPLLARKHCESGHFNALHCNLPISVRVQLFSNVRPGPQLPQVNWKKLNDTQLELKTAPDLAPYEINKEQKLALTGDDPELTEELEKTLMFLFVAKQRGEHLPSHLSLRDLRVMITMKYAKRMQYVKTCVMRELQDEIKTKRKEAFAKSLEEWRKERCNHYDPDVPWLSYHLFGNAMFQRILKRTRHAAEHLHVAQAMQFEQQIVFDCSFDHLMRYQDAKDCAKQILLAISNNRAQVRPYNITFCSFNEKEVMPSNLMFLNPTLFDSPVTFTEESIVQAFPREKLVYLTPDCCDDLEYNPNDIYIIGAFVDKVDKEPYSAGKARRLGIRMARFPLDRYVEWSMGTKSLCLHQVVGVLSVVRDHGDWAKAFALHLPPRKIRGVYHPGSPQKNYGFKKKKFGGIQYRDQNPR